MRRGFSVLNVLLSTSVSTQAALATAERKSGDGNAARMPRSSANDAAPQASAIELSNEDLRAVATWAAQCAQVSLQIFEAVYPDDRRPRAAIEAALAFAAIGKRTRLLRECAWAAHRAAQDARVAGEIAAAEAALAARATAASPFLHPLAKATQVKHILGAAAHATLALELVSGSTGDRAATESGLLPFIASPAVRNVLRRYPDPPEGGGRIGALIRCFSAELR